MDEIGAGKAIGRFDWRLPRKPSLLEIIKVEHIYKNVKDFQGDCA